MLKGLKHRTTVMVQSMKKGEGNPFFDPEFDNASTHLKEFRATIHTFIDDANAILGAIPRVFKAATEFTTLTEKCFATFPQGDQDVSDRLSQLSANMKVFLDARLGAAANDAIIRPLKDIIATLDELAQVQKQQHDSWLILESNKAKLESLQKDADKNAKEVDAYKGKIDTRKAEVERLEAEFIGRMRAAWENRFDVLRGPLSALLTLVTEIGQALVASSDPIAEVLGAELMEKEYPSAEPPQRQAKK
jgi:hypothetical protein